MKTKTLYKLAFWGKNTGYNKYPGINAKNAGEHFADFEYVAGKKINLALCIFRFASLLPTAVFFLMFSHAYLSLFFKAGAVLVLFAASLLLVYCYRHYWQNRKAVAGLAVTELAAISFFLTFTGGFAGPIQWYALNPLVIAAVHLPFYQVWVMLGLFFPAVMIQAYFLRGTALWETASSAIYPALTMFLMLLVIQGFARLYLLLSEQSLREEYRQKELLSAYQDLSDNYHVFQSLSRFQGEIVHYQENSEVLKTLARVVSEVFPLKKTAVITGENTGQHVSRPDSFQVITPDTGKLKKPFTPALLNIQQRWMEFSSQGGCKFIAGEKRDWIAVPLVSGNRLPRHVFVAWVKPGINPLSFLDNLYLFVNFAEQAIQRLHIFKQNEQNLKQLSSLYAAVETISSRNSPGEVTDLFAAYARSMTGCEKSILWMEMQEVNGMEPQPVYSVKGQKDTFPEERWQKELLHAWSLMCANPQPITRPLQGEGGEEKKGELVCVPVTSGTSCLGIFAVIQVENSYSPGDTIQTLSILGELCAIAVERKLSELFAGKLMLLEEQNRIAGEIHDTISQNIFSVVYGLDAISRETEDLLEPRHRERLYSMRNLASSTVRELRLLIYRLSPRKRGDNTFINEIKNYLEGVASLNQVDIKCSFSGKEEYLNHSLSNAFYRIIKEATGNAIRHGKSKKIEVNLEIKPFMCVLTISDNGKGFNHRSPETYYHGNRLGLVNMQELALSLKGELTINSKPGAGTTVTCSVPIIPPPP